MRRRIVTLVASFALATSVSAPALVLVPPDGPLGVGDVAPALEVNAWLHGDPLSLFAPGSVYVIEFWATWCGPCVANIPHLAEMARAYPGRVKVIGATSPDRSGNTLDAVAKFIAAKGARLSHHIAWLPESTGPAGEGGIPFNPWFRKAGMVGPESLPVAFIVDGRGRIAYIGDPLTLEAPLKRIVAGDWDLSAARRRWDESRKAESLRQQLEPLLHSGELAAARSLAFRIVRVLSGDDPRILSLVASSIAASPLKADRALLDIAFEAAARSVSLTRRKAPAMLDGLARIQFLRGDVAGAIETEEAAVALSEGDMQEAEKKILAEFRAAALHSPR